ncbi:hypothetical protein FOXG_20287 [Fusarium oxysporum f. sp. lycopersici 4287]|uniref:Uncharacterized protein n=2 Tax=Fusarium oxysporum TaxID=5507 RepID=A0A0J9WQ14_FUSO4|nr:hypothetical protein FOXG_20287 [Fusarium oxysporum f. sp. lycopersici 4287]EXK40210.1 hypothetical protein FOMG_07150 [Fusarium oxysporum f. sp. melonis 26406]KNB09987.1 hypothetical protein FOXG_20287 [Fusarium oxysporum f. sp. lycopersici 4287]
MNEKMKCVNKQPTTKNSKEEMKHAGLHGLEVLTGKDTSIEMWLRNCDDPFPYGRRASTDDSIVKVRL